MTELDDFYSIFRSLERDPQQGRLLAYCTGKSGWPERGVYFFTEPGETRASGAPRIVRVGTHAVSSGSRTTLWKRLYNHRGGLNAAGGNHRGSIFRLHVGKAMLAREGASLEYWGVGSSQPKPVRASEVDWEQRVSHHLGAMRVWWINADDEPGPSSIRSFVERNAIALLSNRLSPIDRPSDSWLGLHSPEERIRRSGLWNLKHVTEEVDGRFLEEFARLAQNTVDTVGQTGNLNS